MRYYLAAEADAPLPAGVYRRAWPCYRAGARLLRDTKAVKARGGWMLLSAGGETVATDAVANDVLRECLARDYGGVILDWEWRDDVLARLSGTLDRLLPPYRLRLIVPESYAPAAPHAGVIVSTAVVGGSLKSCLGDAVRRYGAQRIALDLERLAVDFTLPTATKQAKHLTLPQLQDVIATQPSYFSEDLCARYCTYRRGSESHYVLFDSADTLRRKSALAESMGIREALLMLPEIADIAPALLAGEP